jgi:hypothetical protein
MSKSLVQAVFLIVLIASPI